MTNGAHRDGSTDGGSARQVLRGTVVLAITRILDRVATFVIALLVASRLGVSGLGSFSAAMAIYQVFAIAGQAGTTNFIVREISRDKTRTGSYVFHLSLIAVVVSVILIAALEAIVPHLGYSSATETATAIIVVAIMGTVLNSVQEATFLSHSRVEFEALSTFVSSAAYIALGAVLLESGHGVSSVMWLYVALEYAVTLVYFVLISRYIARLRFRVHFALVRRLIREIRAFTASSVLAGLFSRPEVVLLSLISTTRQVGYYGAAIRIAELPMFVPEVFMANVFPLLSQTFDSDERRFRDIQAKAVRSMLAFALPLGALMLAAAPGIIGHVFGSRFQPAATLLRILAFNVVFVSLMAVFWRSLAARHRQDVVLRVQIAIIGLRLGGGAALMAPFAALGAAIATAASSALQLILLVAGASRSGAPTPILQPAWRLALAAAVTGGVTWIIASVASVWLALIVGAAVYIPSSLAVGAVSADDRELWGRLRPRTFARS